MSERNLAMCLNPDCGHKWLTKFSPTNMPRQTQCPRCWGYAIVFVEEYNRHLQHLRKLVSPEEAKKFFELYNFAVEHGYVRNPDSREAKFRRLLQDLARSESSLGEKGLDPK